MPTRASTFSFLDTNLDPDQFLALVTLEYISFHFGQSAEDVVLLRLFNKLRHGFYVDVGAFHPRKYSNTFLLHALLGWRGINIDASAESIELFKAERPNDINVLVGISKRSEKQTYTVYDKPARNTFSEKNVARQQTKGDAEIIATLELETKPLADVLKQHLPVGQKIDLMNIDIEGFDMEALESNDWKMFRPKVLIIEDYAFLESSAEKSSIHSFMLEEDYRLISHSFDTSFYLDTHVQLESLIGHSAPTASTLERRQMFDNLPRSGKRLAALSEMIDNGSPGESSGEWVGYRHLLTEIKRRNQELAREIQKVHVQLDEARQRNKQASQERRYFEKKYKELTTSRTWQLTKPLRQVNSIFKKGTE